MRSGQKPGGYTEGVMGFNHKGPVLAGVDGSAYALDAVDYAARLAARHGRALRLVHAFVWPMLGVATGPPQGVAPDEPGGAGLKGQAEAWLDEAAARAAAAAPDVTVTTEITPGAPGAVLLAASAEAGALVVGSRGLGGFGALLLGSVSTQLASYARCPVVVVREAQAPEGPVVVGVDGSAPAEAAVGFAFAEAAARGASVVAVHGGDEKDGGYTRHLLAEALGGWAARYAEVDYTTRFVAEKPAKALVAASEEAGLLVVGSRGRGGFKGLLLGSVSQAAVQYARCPVAVVREDGA